MDRTALITGGSGGLGRAVVAAFAEEGWRVVVPDASPVPLEGAESVEADLTIQGDVDRAVRVAAEREDAPLQAVVNLVGGFASDQPVATTPGIESVTTGAPLVNSDRAGSKLARIFT